MIQEIEAAVNIPVMAKCRIGHFVEARILEALEVPTLTRAKSSRPRIPSSTLTSAPFSVPFVCGCRNLGEALRRVSEGAAMIRPRARRAPATSSRRCGTSAPSLERDPAARRPSGRRSSPARRSGSAAPIDLVTLVAERGTPAGPELRGGRHRDAGGRGALHGAGRRGRSSSGAGSSP